MNAISDDPVVQSQFQSFIDRAKCAMVGSNAELIPAFRRFLASSRSELCANAPQVMAEMRAILGSLRRWLISPANDILRISGRTWNEDAYTNLLAWYLNPATHPASALKRQQAVLRQLGLQEAATLRIPCNVITQFHTGLGDRPDLVLRHPDFAVVVEAKTGTGEHAAPTGELQTVAYVNSVRRRLAVSQSFPVYAAYLTVDRSAAANDEAILFSFCDCATAIATAFGPEDFDDDVAVPLKIVLTHWLSAAAPPNVDLVACVARYSPAVSSDEFYLRHLSAITFLLETFNGGRHGQI